MGEGTGRLMSMLLAIYSSKGGTVLIDEIENGIHYSAMEGSWKALLHAARKADVQLFATTHSWECIQSGHKAFCESGAYDFKHIRLDRTSEGIKAIPYTRETLESAITMNLEVR
jgi:AAA15 family ATPase/GTPase